MVRKNIFPKDNMEEEEEERAGMMMGGAADLLIEFIESNRNCCYRHTRSLLSFNLNYLILYFVCVYLDGYHFGHDTPFAL
jgi:hypothetical protein